MDTITVTRQVKRHTEADPCFCKDLNPGVHHGGLHLRGGDVDPICQGRDHQAGPISQVFIPVHPTETQNFRPWHEIYRPEETVSCALEFTVEHVDVEYYGVCHCFMFQGNVACVCNTSLHLVNLPKLLKDAC